MVPFALLAHSLKELHQCELATGEQAIQEAAGCIPGRFIIQNYLRRNLSLACQACGQRSKLARTVLLTMFFAREGEQMTELCIAYKGGARKHVHDLLAR